MKKILFLFLVAGLFSACKKDNVGTKPVISFLSYDLPAVDSFTQVLNVTFKVQDGDGDIENFVGFKLHYIQAVDPPLTDSFTLAKMPPIGSNKGNSVNAQVIINMTTDRFKLWNEDRGLAPDSLWYTAFVLDNAGHSSDTISTPKLPIYKLTH